MTSPALHHRALHRFALLTAGVTLALVSLGGLVTSHGVGLAVPDWPNTYGYNMFFFPVSQWVGGIFYEHTHRLLASGVGLMTAVLALWLHGRKARPFMWWTGLALLGLGVMTWVVWPKRWADGVVLAVSGLALSGASFRWPQCEPSARWLRRLGWAAFLGVVLQGVLGGLRVVLYRDAIGVFHALLAQLFFVLVCALALFTSRWWQAGASMPKGPGAGLRGIRGVLAMGTGLILVQLVLGAAMRHQHAGLAIPDFPLAYGRLWPALDPAAITRYNQQRLEVTESNPITAAQVVLQMAHRLNALLILAAACLAAWRVWRGLGRRCWLTRWTWAWLGCIGLQALLGAATIWSNKAADIATAHVLIGAVSLAGGSLLCILSWGRWPLAASAPSRVGVSPGPMLGSPQRPAVNLS